MDSTMILPQLDLKLEITSHFDSSQLYLMIFAVYESL